MVKRLIRHYILIFMLSSAALVALWRYGYLALGEKVPSGVDSPIVMVRGSIYDREGRLLAVDTDLYDVSAWRPSLDVGRLDRYASVLSSALGGKADSYGQKLGGEGADFLYLARRVSGEAARSLSGFLAEENLPGFRMDRVAGRVYPEKDLAAHLIGFVGTENRGLGGAEAAYEAELAADPALARGGFAYGNSVFLTIDANLQYRLEELAQAALEEHRAEAIVMVAMEARTGAIVAYVSLPDFDPNDFLAADRGTWLDRVAIYAYEPGSVFKVYSMASIMSLGGIDEHSSFVCDGAYERTLPSGEEITIKCLGVHGVVDMTRILEYSCNVGAAYASDTISTIDFYAKLREFGFGERPGADLAGESPGVFRAPSLWSGRTKPTVAIGQEILVTALQMTAAATTLANGGIMLRPRTLARIVDADGASVLVAEPVAVRRVLDERTASAVLADMEAVVLDSGTGWRARIEDLRMSVKTGTAQMIDPVSRRYSPDDFIASTLALFPSEAPEYIVYAAIIKPRGSSTYGGRIVAPLVKDAANTIADLYGIARAGSASVTHDGRIVLPSLGAAAIGATMPDLTGLPKRLLTPLLERRDITVEIEGDGWVVRQDPGPGEPVPAGSTVRLVLE
ncbi:MAG: PASTA domain-containing protein [Spirochaetales bacterium]|nr:MAG: PASTA domain-containing protein [Spirochaetales bacterium]